MKSTKSIDEIRKKLENFKFSMIKNFINALNCFLEKEKDLLDIMINERAIVCRLAMHLQKFFPSYHVDCEYNMVFDVQAKTLLNVTKKLNSELSKKEEFIQI